MFHMTAYKLPLPDLKSLGHPRFQPLPDKCIGESLIWAHATHSTTSSK